MAQKGKIANARVFLVENGLKGTTDNVILHVQTINHFANRTVNDADLVDGVVKLAAGKKKIVLVKPV